MKIIILIFCFVCSCADESIYYLCLDRNCPYEYEDMTKSAIEEMNNQYYDHGGDRQLIAYGGLQQYFVTDIETIEAKNDGVDVIICSYDTDPAGPVGHGIEDADIMLYVNRIQSVLEEVVLFHELGHYVGMGHSSNRNSVMYPYLWGQEAPWFTDDDWRQVE